MTTPEVRHLKWQLKVANKERGKQGQTIHELRNEVAALRQRLASATKAAILAEPVWEFSSAPTVGQWNDALDRAEGMTQEEWDKVVNPTAPASCIEGLA